MTGNPKDESADKRPIPSQPEGEDPPTGGTGDRPVPSQAEGDDETIDEALEQKENRS